MCSIFVTATYPSVIQIAERLRPPYFRFNRSALLFAYGFIFGLILALALLLLTYVFGARYRIGSSFEMTAALHCFARATFHATTEEILFRDIAIRKLRPRLGLILSVLTQAALFSAVHGFNLSIFGYINLFLVAIFLALVKLKTGTLWTCIGIHVAWNFFQTVAKGDVFVDVRTTALLNQFQASMVPDEAIGSGMFLCCCLLLLHLQRNTVRRDK